MVGYYACGAFILLDWQAQIKASYPVWRKVLFTWEPKNTGELFLCNQSKQPNISKIVFEQKFTIAYCYSVNLVKEKKVINFMY